MLPTRMCEKLHQSRKKMEEEEDTGPPSPLMKHDFYLQRSCSRSCWADQCSLPLEPIGRAVWLPEVTGQQHLPQGCVPAPAKGTRL